MNKLDLLDAFQAVIDAGNNKREILEKLQPLFEPLTDLQKFIYASFVSHALKNKFERDQTTVV